MRMEPRQFPRFLQNLGKSLEKTSSFSSCPTRRANKFLLYIDNGSSGPYVADINNEGANWRIRRHCAPFFHIRKFNFDNVCQKVRLGIADLYLSLWSSSSSYHCESLVPLFCSLFSLPFIPRVLSLLLRFFYTIIDDLRSDIHVLKAVAFIGISISHNETSHWITMWITKNKIYKLSCATSFLSFN